ncbi:hypothetical protein [Sphingobium yanoikuyae]|uniref:hypothetical protein n=1 Tax=Sphingobium yanoikuyae TaxID=13690 RepID=UPI0004962A4C|nr:hypothetical protein [Sphingobium yanoikuyae]
MPRKKAANEVAKAVPAEPLRSTKIANLRAKTRGYNRVEAGEERLMLNIRSSGANSSTREPLGAMDENTLTLRLADAMGTTSPEFIDDMLVNLLTYFNAPTDRRATREINAALAVLDGMKPENEVEAMLLGQMVATNDAAMKCLSQINSLGAAETFGNLSVKLMRTFTAQTEALAKLRRKGEQTVRVVHIHPGGQAVVGDVHNHQGTGGGGQQSESEGQSNAADNSGSGRALPSPNPIGETVPIASGRRQEAMPHARRHKPRRAEG